MHSNVAKMADKGNNIGIFICFVVLCWGFLEAKKASSSIERISDHKDWKKLLRTRNNVLAVFVSSEKDFTSNEDLLESVAKEMKGMATIVNVNCLDDKKLCKKLKVSPTGILLKHYKDGEFHKDYDRRLIAKSMVTFLKTPDADAPWEEEEGADSVIHLVDQKNLNKAIKKNKALLVMFYAPWCGHCKRMKPEFAAAAVELKGKMSLAGMDVDGQEQMGVRMLYNITGFPTIVYFTNGVKQFNYGGGKTKADILEWANDPQPPKEEEKEPEWSETESDVVHLTDEDFPEFMEAHSSVLVMFYAPWCGHCKKMKPEYVSAAATLKAEGVDGVIAAVDATKATALGEKFEVKGYPTVKYFKNGEEQFVVSKRTAAELVEFMKDPQEPPPPPPPEPEWSETASDVIHLTEDTFKTQLKKKKSMLVMFYAPWCGHCKKAKPEFTEAAAKFAGNNKVGYAAIDCTKHKEPCNKHDVQGYPTFISFRYGKDPQKYTGGREEADFVSFMTDPKSSTTTPGGEEEAAAVDSWEGIEGAELVHHLTQDTFDAFVKEKNQVLVIFYAPGCRVCLSHRPAIAEAARALAIGEHVFGYLATVNIDAETQLGERFKIESQPTLKFFRNGEYQFDFHGGIDASELVRYMKNPRAKPPAVPEGAWTDIASEVKHLTTDNHTAFLMDHKHVLVMYYAPWCGHCSNAKPYFQEAANVLKGKDKYLAALDCTAYKDLCTEQGVKGYPTMLLYKHGVEVEKYTGGRRTDDFVNYMIAKDSNKKQEL